MKTREEKREEALERAKAYKPDPSKFGLRRKIKDGILEAEDIDLTGFSPSFIKWLAGRK